MQLDIGEVAANRSFVFLWCGSSEGLDMGRFCLRKWGFRRCEDICWIRTNAKNPGHSKNLEAKAVFQRTKVSLKTTKGKYLQLCLSDQIMLFGANYVFTISYIQLVVVFWLVGVTSYRQWVQVPRRSKNLTYKLSESFPKRTTAVWSCFPKFLSFQPLVS